ncbi:MAG: DEAD/DEAH box helicase [Chitinophagales bacterium]|nr:DEAD/DEAH box helicase [Chitinophagales bacterium]
MNFKEFGLDERILEAISYMGFDSATPIQEGAIPKILDGCDLIACAQTGTGKTAAFMLPVLHKLADSKVKGVKALVIVPTRELAIQIDQQIQGFSYFVPIASASIYGGGSGNEWDQEKRALENADIIISTPGRLISHINVKNTNFDNLKILILDEADRMMDMGFYEDIQKIISKLPKDRQTLMFSATMPDKIRSIVKKNMIHPSEISLAISKPSEKVVQAAYLVNDGHKPTLIHHLIKDKPNYEKIIIFSSTKRAVREIIKGISGHGYGVEGISSDLDQQQREEVLNKFKANLVRVIVATDVLSRGIDIKDVDLVINYNVPSDAEDYVHRIGRTARADASGLAITLVNEEEMYKLADVEKVIEAEIPKINLPAEIGISPEWNPKKYKAVFKHKGSNPSKKFKKKPTNKHNSQGQPRAPKEQDKKKD